MSCCVSHNAQVENAAHSHDTWAESGCPDEAWRYGKCAMLSTPCKALPSRCTAIALACKGQKAVELFRVLDDHACTHLWNG
eukprot:3500833-Amphidinium_carterae.1